MRNCGQSLSREMMGKDAETERSQVLGYEKIISSQQEVIKLLQKQNTQLRQYLNYVADFEPSNPLYDPFPSILHPNLPSSPNSKDPMNGRIVGFKGLIGSIMKELEVSHPNEIMGELKKTVEKANHKPEPIFVERVKEKEVPVYIEKIVEVPIKVEKAGKEERNFMREKGIDKTRCTETNVSVDSDNYMHQLNDTFFKQNKTQCRQQYFNDQYGEDWNRKTSKRGRRYRGKY